MYKYMYIYIHLWTRVCVCVQLPSKAGKQKLVDPAGRLYFTDQVRQILCYNMEQLLLNGFDTLCKSVFTRIDSQTTLESSDYVHYMRMGALAMGYLRVKTSRALREQHMEARARQKKGEPLSNEPKLHFHMKLVKSCISIGTYAFIAKRLTEYLEMKGEQPWSDIAVCANMHKELVRWLYELSCHGTNADKEAAERLTRELFYDR
jgi:hypothetical protein